MKASGSAKRRRIFSSSSNRSDICIFDLPNEALSYAASYLARPSKALFAIALRHDTTINDDATIAILSLEQFGVLDFGEVEKTLAAKISDDDLREILICIDASTKLKKLKLAGCINITGVGLTPLCESVVLQQIDLSLVAEHKSPVIDPQPLMSCDLVLTILDSIIGSNVLVHRIPKELARRGKSSAE